MKNKIIYRGADINWILSYLKGDISGYSNFVNDLEFAKDYSSIICEFEIISDINLIEENIKDRLDNVVEYDELLRNNKSGISWDIGDGVIHYRLDLNLLKLKKIIYLGDYKENISNYFILNRKYRSLSQEKLASLLGTKKTNISKYEHAKNIPDLKRLLEILAPIGVSQIIEINGKRLSFG